MVRVKNFFALTWKFFSHDMKRLVGYLITSQFIWCFLCLWFEGHRGMLEAGNIIGIIFAVFGCITGFCAASCFSSGKKGSFFRSVATDTDKPFAEAATSELLKVMLSVWVTVYPTIPLSYMGFGDGMSRERLTQITVLGICYASLYFTVGLFAGGVSGRALPRIVVCLSYYLLSAGINYYFFALFASFFQSVSALRHPFVFNAPLMEYDVFMEMSGCTDRFIVEGVYPHPHWDHYYFVSGDQFWGMVVTACLFFAVSLLVFIKRDESKSGDALVFKGLGATVTTLFAVEIHYIINTGIGSLLLRHVYSYQRFDRGIITYLLIDIPILICVFIVASLLCTRSFKGVLKSLKLLPITAVAAYLIQFVSFWEDIF